MAWFKYKNKNIWYDERGAGQPLLLLHGNTASGRMFDAVAELYIRDFRVITIDFLGHGRSGRIERFPADLWFDEAMQVVEFLRQRACGKVDIIGTSGGAIVAVNVALEAPELVGKVIADSFEGEAPPAEFAGSIVVEREASKQAPAFYIYNHGADWESVVDNDTRAIEEHYRTIGKFFHRSLDELKVPVLLTGSRGDEYVPSGFFERTYGDMLAKIPRGTMHLFDEGGHPAMLSNAEEFAEVARQFFKETVIRKIEGDYPYNLLLQADETREGIDQYLFDSQVWVARVAERDEPVGVMCLLPRDADTVELMNIAVDEPCRGRGIGGKMIEEAVRIAASEGYREIILGTGTEDCALAQIRFYERHGFRKSHLRENYFVEKYPDEPIFENGVQMRDMQVLKRDL